MPRIPTDVELTFDDVLLVPRKSSFLIEDERKHIKLTTRITNTLSLDVPITSAPMPGVTEDEMAIALGTIGGLGFIHHFQSFERQLTLVAKTKQHAVRVAACVGDMTDAGLKQVASLLKLGVDLISVETAHAHNTQTIRFVRKIKRAYPKAQISAALLIDAEGTEALIQAGADNIRVGIGGGSHCTTRLVTGTGRPQLSALAACYKVTKKHNIPLLSDTGIKYAGDIAKAIAFGADAVMIGGMFSGTDECPGPVVYKDGARYKRSWGMCTELAIRHDAQHRTPTQSIKRIIKRIIGKPVTAPYTFEEGVDTLIPYKGSVQPILQELISGTMRSMWYQGMKSVSELQQNARVVRVSPNTMQENLPRV